MRVRQSSLGSFDKCPRSLQYSLEAPSDTYYGGIVRAVGTGYHAGLEWLYRERMEGRSPSASDLSLMIGAAVTALTSEITRSGDNFVWDEKFPTFTDAATGIEKMLTAYMVDGHAWPDDWTILGVELPFELPFVNGHSRGGTMDLVLLDPTGRWVVGVDHKTAGKKWDQYKHLPRKNNQAPFYCAALAELFPGFDGYRFAFDVMTYKGEFERRISDPSPAHIAATLAKAEQVATLYDTLRGLNMDLPANPSSNLCSRRYCDHYAVCPHGAPAE